MINLEIEKEIVNSFVHKDYRDRILYELTSKKKRRDGIYHLGEKLKSSCIIDITKRVHTPDFLLEIFERYGAKKTDDAYVLNHEEILPLEKAIYEYMYKCDIFIYWIKGKIGFYADEMWSSGGTPPLRYIIKNPTC